ncbi:hypothetical protein KAR91_67710 [Candidatus Pacearchaeota archaeon]|nr:hypothetical protein [Candidatus Pacearchaeota archaeon]
MDKQIEIVIQEVEKFNDSIRDALNSKDISDTGEAARSLFVEHGKDFVQSIGIFYIEFLDTGRAPGKFPPRAPIARWVESKLGISPTDPEFNGIVYVISKKIADLGTTIFRNQGKGIELDKKIVTLRKNLTEALTESVKTTIKQKLDKFKRVHIKNKYGI